MSEISSVMSTELVTVSEKTSVIEAIGLLMKHNITGLPVVDKKSRPVGIVSEKDMLRLVYKFKTKSYDSETRNMTVGDVMTTDIVTFDVNDRLSDVCKCLMENGFRRVPILSDGILVGVISRKDLLQVVSLQ